MENIIEQIDAKRLTFFFDSLSEEEKKGFYSLAELSQYKLLIVKQQNGRIVGISGILPRNVLFLGLVPKNLFFLLVKNGYQNQGIGQKLSRTVIQTAIRRNYSYLALYVYQSNDRAIHIYQKLGFRKIHSPFMGKIDFMLLPLSFLGWLFFPLLSMYFFIAPLKHVVKTFPSLSSQNS